MDHSNHTYTISHHHGDCKSKLSEFKIISSSPCIFSSFARTLNSGPSRVNATLSLGSLLKIYNISVLSNFSKISISATVNMIYPFLIVRSTTHHHYTIDRHNVNTNSQNLYDTLTVIMAGGQLHRCH